MRVVLVPTGHTEYDAATAATSAAFRLLDVYRDLARFARVPCSHVAAYYHDEARRCLGVAALAFAKAEGRTVPYSLHPDAYEGA